MADIDKRLAEIKERREHQTEIVAFSTAQSHLADLDLALQSDTSATRFSLGVIRAEVIIARQDIAWLLARDKAREAALEAAAELAGECQYRGLVTGVCPSCGGICDNHTDDCKLAAYFNAGKENSDA